MDKPWAGKKMLKLHLLNDLYLDYIKSSKNSIWKPTTNF